MLQDKGVTHEISGTNEHTTAAIRDREIEFAAEERVSSSKFRDGKSSRFLAGGNFYASAWGWPVSRDILAQTVD